MQGVGFRPFVWTLAQRFACTGWVCNDSEGVLLEIQSDAATLDAFVAAIAEQHPPTASIASLTSTLIEGIEDESGFEIRASQHALSACAVVSPDLATCSKCLTELWDPSNRRYLYPFTNCTHCGPRFTIQVSVPYDRRHTTMHGFPLCPVCRQEYESPSDRRFHAQPNACPECGPAIWYVQCSDPLATESPASLSSPPPWNARPESPPRASEVQALLDTIRSHVLAGSIVGIKGIGGFHIACDARNADAVRTLRLRKHRPSKPLAIMVADIETVRQFVVVGPHDEALLTSPQRPIVLLRKRGALLPDEVAPRNPYLGVMLPYSPLHHLLLRSGEAWVMTSGNLSDEPIAFENQDAWNRLKSICDGIVFHDRPIHAVCDDSVVRSRPGGWIPIRRARGYAPLPIRLTEPGPPVLAVGGEVKTALCLAVREHAVMGPHLGDMGNRETVLAMERSRTQLESLYATTPECIVADAHPGYLSSEWATRYAEQAQIPFMRAQHHHAHAVALMAEHAWPRETPILACVLDGTGYGLDGSIWGGEILFATATDFRRAAHWQAMPLPGGDSSIRHPAKVALAFLWKSGIPWSDHLPPVASMPSADRQRLLRQLERNLHTIPTSSMGRLFDAVASLLGVQHENEYEGQAAMELEARAWEAVAGDCVGSADRNAHYAISWDMTTTPFFRTDLLLRHICEDVLMGSSVAEMAAKFHETIAEALVEISRYWRERSAREAGPALDTVGLTGGVFQNALILESAHRKLERAGFQVLMHSQVPPNDGGLALGQAWIARARLSRSENGG